jgi:hypothetical protein
MAHHDGVALLKRFLACPAGQLLERNTATFLLGPLTAIRGRRTLGIALASHRRLSPPHMDTAGSRMEDAVFSRRLPSSVGRAVYAVCWGRGYCTKFRERDFRHCGRRLLDTSGRVHLSAVSACTAGECSHADLPAQTCAGIPFRAVTGRFMPACRRAFLGHEVVRCVSRFKRASRCCAPILRR